ncbi:MAG: hypothetical protein F4213_05595 [Boseongicola sp. SB0677_bin_26]|nr:hypothetical protein [Boseongicola sp. SB0677_bin_26]
MSRSLLPALALLVLSLDLAGACDIPATEGRPDLYGHTRNRDGIDRLNPDFRDRVAAMIDAARAEVGGEITIYSGYRSPAHQQELWDRAAAKYPDEQERRKWVAKPGSSMHNYGLAVDLRHDGRRIEYGEPVSDWLEANIHRFGLVRPLGNEGWHVEPAGARESRDRWMSGTDPSCQEGFSSGISNSLDMVLMPWAGDGWSYR